MLSHETDTARPTFITPLIDGFGAIVALPQTAEQPRAGSKVVFDITGAGDATQSIKGLESIALLLNLAAEAGLRPEEFKIVAVLHGQATKAVLRPDSYAKATQGSRNPNLELIRQLKSAGVELYVCGQALAHGRYGLEEVLSEVTVATSAVTVNVSRQMDGYAYLPFH